MKITSKSTAADFWLRFSARIYRSLIFTLPKEFRRNYAEEMILVFRDCCRSAYTRRGFPGILRELLHSSFDLLFNAAKEGIARIFSSKSQSEFFVLNLFSAVSAGLVAAFADLRYESQQSPICLILISTFTLGFLRQSSFWISGLLVGLVMPAVHILAQIFQWDIKYQTNPGMPVWAFVALIPALLGATGGALTRRLLNYIRFNPTE